MKKTSLLALILVPLMAAPVFAQTASNPLTVQATVTANCTVDTATLNFGNYDPLVTHAATDLAVAQALTLKCTKGTAATSIDLDPGANNSSGRRMKTGASDYLNYELYKESSHTNVWKTGATNGVVPATSTSKNSPLKFSDNSALQVFGLIPQNQDITIGAYSDTVQITINF